MGVFLNYELIQKMKQLMTYTRINVQDEKWILLFWLVSSLVSLLYCLLQHSHTPPTEDQLEFSGAALRGPVV